ncbi:sodium:proton antiporter [Mobilicoccus caccae]|uniref:Multisubunit sodium/proton antiporter, MrpC subunit n=1 Tax=Mobilicoccus caccae TaxID=1859295 RepID=A0ABQ6IUL0_9MICO|nr:cation:proton antiporter subunit C [Mobilicoccus caccae]GMA41615.1 hypothetical protein GCM10025883_36600 [Mobilicoccus caccae]
MALALAVAVLVGGGVLLILRRGMLRVVVGFILIGNGANLLLVTAGGASRRNAALSAAPDPATTADPLPQAFVLTAIVIAFAITVYMLVLSVVGDEDDDTDMPVEGREAETPDLLDADDPQIDEVELRYLDRADQAGYRRRLRAGKGHLEKSYGWSEEDW